MIEAIASADEFLLKLNCRHNPERNILHSRSFAQYLFDYFRI
jgi:hypothetical protein